jgi:WD40 repeat protein
MLVYYWVSFDIYRCLLLGLFEHIYVCIDRCYLCVSIDATREQDPDLLKPYISTRFQPNVKIDKDLLKTPVEYLELEHVHGFAGFNRIGNLHYVQTGEVLYTVACVAVLQDTSSGKQSYFRKHSDEIVAVTLHKDGQLVATADNGPTSTIFVWSSVTMEAIMRLSPTAGATVVAMCFSGDKSKLIVVNEIKDAAIEIFDW